MAREGPGGGSAFAAVCACLHTGIIYHNISLRARLLIISFSVGAVGSGKKSRLVGISKSLCVHVRGADAKKVNGLRRCCGGSSCEEETAVWCAEAVSVCVCVCVRAWVPIFLCTCTNTCVDRCTVPRGEKVTHTPPPPQNSRQISHLFLATQQTLVPPVPAPNTPFLCPDPAMSVAGPLSAPGRVTAERRRSSKKE